MPLAVMFQLYDKIHTVYFSNFKAKLPVKTRTGIHLVQWGRRQSEQGVLPFGGWARLEAIQKGSWDYFIPKPVKLPIKKFLENDSEGQAGWYDVTGGRWLQGLIAKESDELRVYIVTITPGLFVTNHDRWPRILSG